MKRWIKIIACLMVTALLVTVCPVALTVGAETATVKLADATAKVKLLGRTTADSSGIEPHTTGAGIAFYSECSGKITLTMTGTPTKFNSLYVAVFIDGEMHRVEFVGNVNRASTKELVIAENLAAGKHRIEIVRETEENYGRYVWTSLTINGDITPVEQAPMLIEFVGDSITAGYASYPQTDDNKKLSVEHPAFEAGVNTYAYLAAKALGADFQSVCASGYGVVKGWNNDRVTLSTMYDYAGYYHNKTESGKWSFERKADIVVINLGTNDKSKGVTDAEMQTGAKALMQQVRQRNPDAAVVWVSGAMSTVYEQPVKAVIEELGGEEAKFYFAVLPEGSSGGAGHPNLDEHAAASEALVEFLKADVLPPEPTTVVVAPTVPSTKDTGSNIFMWIAIISGGAVLSAAVVTVAIVLLKKKKNPTA